MCFICAEPVKHYALGPCSHRLCHVCLIRLRALYQKTKCTFCQTEQPVVIFTNDPTSPFDSFDLSKLVHSDPKLSIFCETRDQLDSLLSLLRFNCPHSACDSILSGWSDLKFHTRAAHGLVMCDLCTRHKKIFSHEHTLFTPLGLGVHLREGEVGEGKGQEGSGAKDGGGEGFTGHPRCEFCGVHFYDADLLYAHCRDKHEQCFICVRNGTGRWQYYLDYKSLEAHFRQGHHLCPSSTCLEKRFVVFENAFELQAHQVSDHATELGKGAVQAARRLETNFTYPSEPHHSPAPQAGSSRGGGGGGRRGGGTERVMNITPVGGAATALTDGTRPVPGLGPRRQERNGFGANLTVEEEVGARAASRAAEGSSTEQARHAELMSRVQKAVGGSETKIAAYKSAVRTYRNSETSAAGFVDTLWRVLGDGADMADEIITSTVELLDSGEKRAEALEQWSRFQSERTNFPSLSGLAPSTSLRRAQPTIRPGQRNTAVWARVEAAARSRPLPAPAPAPPRERFPALSKPVANRSNVPGLTPRAGVANSSLPRTAWSAAASTSAGGSGSSTPIRSGSPNPGPRPVVVARYDPLPPPGPAESSFPSLPSNLAVAERQARVKQALAKSKGRVDNPSPPIPGQWGSQAGTGAGAGTVEGMPDVAGLRVGQGGTGQGRTKKPKKVLLYSNSVL